MFSARFTASNLMRSILAPFTALPSPTREAATERRALFDLYDLYYHNAVYERTADGGAREAIVRALGAHAANDIFGLYNPIARAVDLYQHVFDGKFGIDIIPDPRLSAPGLLQPLANGLTPPAQIWAWSNLNQQKWLLAHYAANLGTCGLRIVAQNHPDPARKRVWLKPEHPRIIQDVTQDTRGNVTGIVLRYEEIIGLGDAQQVITIQEEQTKDAFTFYEVTAAGTLLPLPQRSGANDLGVVPYVLLNHRPTGQPFGTNCYYRLRAPIDHYNALNTHINRQIHDYVNATWLLSASGDPPTEMDIGGRNVLYFNTRGGDAPTAEALVANLSLADAIVQAKEQRGLIADEMPELKATSGQFLSGQSGETIAELRKPAIDAIATARDFYEDGLARATQIALSWGVLMGLWDLGAGMGTVEAADRSYHGGYETFEFNQRPILGVNPETMPAAPALNAPQGTSMPNTASTAVAATMGQNQAGGRA